MPGFAASAGSANTVITVSTSMHWIVRVNVLCMVYQFFRGGLLSSLNSLRGDRRGGQPVLVVLQRLEQGLGFFAGHLTGNALGFS